MQLVAVLAHVSGESGTWPVHLVLLFLSLPFVSCRKFQVFFHFHQTGAAVLEAVGPFLQAGIYPQVERTCV